MRPIDVTTPEFVESFDELPFWSARFGALLFRHLEVKRDLDILDVGTGTGFPLFELAHVHGTSCRLVGVDPWKEALARAERKRQVWGLDHVRLVEADASALPFADAAFDLVVSNLGVNNFADPPRVLAECARVSRPGARLVLTTNPVGTFREVYAALRDVLAADGTAEELERVAAHEAHRGTATSLAARVEAAGYRVTRRFEDTFSFRFPDGAALLGHGLVRVGFLDGWRGTIAPERQERVMAQLSAALDRRAAEEGELVVTVPMLYLQASRSVIG